MRILIIGGLGYIGSALIEQYKLVKDNNVRVDILDKQFLPHVVANLPENFHFVEGDMTNDTTIDSLLAKRPDIIYLLGAEVEAEKSINKEKAVWEINYEAPLKIIKKCPRNSRIMFASTGNVFGGLSEAEKYLNLTEEDEPKPRYAYAESKRAVEKYLLDSHKDFVICRFGGNYGYAPGIRFNLVINNFIKKALSGETIAVFGGGENFRPTVCVKDSARAMLFLSKKKEAKGEIFHVVCQNFKIKDLAQKISSFGFSPRLEYISKEVPFSSYHLSNEKIKKWGFSFNWDLEKAVKDMKKRFISLKR